MPRPRRPFPLITSVLCISLPFIVGCGSEVELSPLTYDVSSTYTVPESLEDLAAEHFFDHPWPSDLRIVDGSPRLTGYYNPLNVTLITDYVAEMHGVLDGFSPVGAGYVRFDSPIDPATLPADPTAARAADASVQLIDVDPTSPDYGQRQTISLEWRAPAGVYWLANTLAFMPTLGFPLRPHTKYAFVVTTQVKGARGQDIKRSADLDQALGLATPDERTQPATNLLAPAVADLGRIGIAASDIVQFSVFTTGDPVREMFMLADGLPAAVPPPQADPSAWVHVGYEADYDEYTGMYGPSPNFQHGNIPFEDYSDGGGFVFEDDKPVVADTFDLRFSLSVPKADKCPMPTTGYPIVLYAHGTGGDYRSYTYDGTAQSLAQQCLASMGIDQIFHGTRPGAPLDGSESTEEVLFFNLDNITAARANTRQSAADEIQRARLFTESHQMVPSSVSATGAPIVFDPTRLMFFGHSQGGLNGPLYIASDASARGAVLSGSSSTISITLLEKTAPEPSVATLVKLLLGLDETEAEELDEFHPAISFAQSVVDVVDPVHYARYSILEPRPGFAAKSVYLTEGINSDGTGDSYAPPHGIEAHGIAMGLPLQLPGTHAILELEWGGPKPVTVPTGGLEGNLAGGKAAGVLAQWAVPAGSDGHFVVFDVPDATLQAAGFLRNLADDPHGDVPAP